MEPNDRSPIAPRAAAATCVIRSEDDRIALAMNSLEHAFETLPDSPDAVTREAWSYLLPDLASLRRRLLAYAAIAERLAGRIVEPTP